MRTEISTKFTRERLEGDLAAAGLDLAHWLTDPERLYAVSLARPRGVATGADALTELRGG
jgi:L-histidine N-alpha-methyltransferase